MADWTWRTVTTTVKVYALPNPTNWSQVRQVLHAIDQELPEDKRRWDNTVAVRATDEEIVFSYVLDPDERPF